MTVQIYSLLLENINIVSIVKHSLTSCVMDLNLMTMQVIKHDLI